MSVTDADGVHDPFRKWPPCVGCGSTLRPGASSCPVCGPHAHGRPIMGDAAIREDADGAGQRLNRSETGLSGPVDSRGADNEPTADTSPTLTDAGVLAPPRWSELRDAATALIELGVLHAEPRRGVEGYIIETKHGNFYADGMDLYGSQLLLTLLRNLDLIVNAYELPEETR